MTKTTDAALPLVMRETWSAQGSMNGRDMALIVKTGDDAKDSLAVNGLEGFIGRIDLGHLGVTEAQKVRHSDQYKRAMAIENTPDMARALEKAKVAIALLLPYAQMHLMAAFNRRGDTKQKRAARAEAFRSQAAASGAIGTLTDALKAGRIARDEAADVLVNAVGEG